MKNFKIAFVFLFITAMVFAPVHPLHGEAAASVSFAVESYDKTLFKTTVNANTFFEALRAAEKAGGLDIVLSNDGNHSAVYSINGVAEKKFRQDDGWYGYVMRNGTILMPENYLPMPLEDGDAVVIYYGSRQNTKIATNFEAAVSGSKITFTAKFEQARWANVNGKWVQQMASAGIEQMKIRINAPGGRQINLITDGNGNAKTTFSKLGFYAYYGEGYVNGGPPTVVRTEDCLLLYGVKNPNRVTRGEAAAFIVNAFGISPGPSPKYFADVKNTYPNAAEIRTAASAGLIAGIEDDLFLPDEPINLMQFATMLAGTPYVAANGGSAGQSAATSGAPEWAQEKINQTLLSGLLDDIGKNWNRAVTAELLEQVYRNMQD